MTDVQSETDQRPSESDLVALEDKIAADFHEWAGACQALGLSDAQVMARFGGLMAKVQAS